MKRLTASKTWTLALLAVFSLSACSSPISSDFRLRFWEKFMALGERSMGLGDYRGADRMFQCAVDQAMNLGAKDVHVIIGLTNLGWSLLASNDVTEAQRVFGDALSKCKDDQQDALIDPRLLKARSLAGLASCARVRKDYDAAGKDYVEALRLFEACGMHTYDFDGMVQNSAREGLADVLLHEGKVAEALNLISSATKWDWSVTPGTPDMAPLDKKTRVQWLAGLEQKALDSTQQLWVVNCRDGLEALSQHDLPAAEAFFKDALNFATTAKNDCGVAEASLYLARTYRQEGKRELAVKCLQDAIKLRQQKAESKIDWLQAVLHEELAEVDLDHGEHADAEQHLAEASKIRLALNTVSPTNSIKTLAMLAYAQQAQGKKAPAQQSALQCLDIARQFNASPNDMKPAASFLAAYFFAINDPAKAEQWQAIAASGEPTTQNGGVH